jgi:mono/diheme cytochrome c family protein
MQRGLLYGNWQFARDDEAARKVINGGLAEKGMPGFGAALKPDQITALIQYMRQNQTTAPEPGRPIPSNARNNRQSEYE